MNTPDVTWQPSLDDDWTLAMYPDWPKQKLGKKARKKAKKLARKLARLEQTYVPAPARPLRERQVRLDDAEGHGLRLIFCDFDGVLNQHASGNYELLPELVERLDRLARECGAVLVVSSWWRWIGVEQLRSDLASAGFHGRLIGRTPWLGEDEMWDARERGIEIDAVLAYLGDRVQTFVILDDHDRMGRLMPHLVQTVAADGLTESDIERAAAILLPRPVAMLQEVSPNTLTPEHAPSYTLRSAPDGVAASG